MSIYMLKKLLKGNKLIMKKHNETKILSINFTEVKIFYFWLPREQQLKVIMILSGVNEA